MTSSPEVAVDDTAQLLSDNEEPGCCRRRKRKPGGWFFIEPVLIMYCFSEFPLMIIGQKYVLDWITIHLFNATGSGGSVPGAPDYPPSPCDPNISQHDRELDDRVQSLTSLFTVVHSVVWGIPALIVTILLGGGSDRIGRRFAILPPLFGILFNSAVMFCVLEAQLNFVFFFIGAFVYGCCGASTAVSMSCFIYVADRTPPEKRMVRITVLQMCMLVAGVVSPIGVGPLVSAIGAANVPLIIVFLSALNFAYVFIFLRNDDHDHTVKDGEASTVERDTVDEQPAGLGGSGTIREGVGGSGRLRTSLRSDLGTSGDLSRGRDDGLPRFRPHPPRSGEMIDWSHSLNRDDLPFGVQPHSDIPEARVERQTRTLCEGVRHVISLFLSPGPYRVRLNILLAAFFVSTLPLYDFTLLNLFQMNRPLCWTIKEIGTFIGVSLAYAAVGAVITAPLMKLCVSDCTIAVVASVASVITNVYKFFIENSAMMYISSSLAMFILLLGPSIRSTMSGLVSEHEQGAVFGAIASVEVLCSMLGTVIFNSIYSSTLDVAPGFVFLVMALFYVVAVGILLAYQIKTKLEGRHQQVLLQCDVTEPDGSPVRHSS